MFLEEREPVPGGGVGEAAPRRKNLIQKELKHSDQNKMLGHTWILGNQLKDSVLNSGPLSVHSQTSGRKTMPFELCFKPAPGRYLAVATGLCF